jgi:hypothetical protein
MPTNFPTSVDSLVNPLSTDPQNAPSHSAQHANANDAIEAIETYLLEPFTVLANGTTAMALAANINVRVTPTANATFTTTVPAAGLTATIMILTSGASSYTITFGSGFRTTGTLATGTTTARYFMLSFISDGTVLVETSRTAAMA